MARKAEYGRGSNAFLEYTKFIAKHPNYQGMPDTYLDDGNIQWEAPSNRSSGKFQFTHQRRLDWWRNKAKSINIDTNSAHWISRVAKNIHPTNKKPCKNCGRIMDIRYVYPSNFLIRRLTETDYFNDDFPLDSLEDIFSIISSLYERYGDQIFQNLPTLLKTKSLNVPTLDDNLESWLTWIEEIYIRAEPRLLSPGAMSNAPDRFDGFHSFNRCCRATADKGRSKENLRSYTTDRRVFEYWVDGNWVAADRLMGMIRTLPRIQESECLNGHPGPCQADHIGPISLGFSHRPEFQLLCRACNSSKNNRMSLRDVELLKLAENDGQEIVSWYAKDLWNICKEKVETDENALRLSKLLRDNRHSFMSKIWEIEKEKKLTFLSTLLGLNFATNEPDFINLRIENHLTKFDQIDLNARSTKYVSEQQARRLRIAFQVLQDYFSKNNRNEYIIESSELESLIEKAISALSSQPLPINQIDQQLCEAIELHSEEKLRELASRISQLPTNSAFQEARSCLEKAMQTTGELLAEKWEDPRYVREQDFYDS